MIKQKVEGTPQNQYRFPTRNFMIYAAIIGGRNSAAVCLPRPSSLHFLECCLRTGLYFIFFFCVWENGLSDENKVKCLDSIKANVTASNSFLRIVIRNLLARKSLRNLFTIAPSHLAYSFNIVFS